MKTTTGLTGVVRRDDGLTGGVRRSEPTKVTAQIAAEQTKKTVADLFITRTELDEVKALSQQAGQPLAKQYLQEFAKLAEARFSAANPDVKGFIGWLVRQLDQTDPVMQVSAWGVAEFALRNLWSSVVGTGGAAERSVLEDRFASGKTSAIEAVVEATVLSRDDRAAALKFFAGRIRSDADAEVLLTAGSANVRLGELGPNAMTFEQQRDVAVALASNPNLSAGAAVGAVRELLEARGAPDSTLARLRSEVLHAALKAHPGAQTANRVLELFSTVLYGPDFGHSAMPLAEDMLANGAKLGSVVDAFFHRHKYLHTELINIPRPAAELILRHAGEAKTEDMKSIATVLHLTGDSPLEQQILSKLTEGKADTTAVLDAIAKSGTVVRYADYENTERAAGVQFDRQRAELALKLYARPNNTNEELVAIHRFATQHGSAPAELKSLETLIEKGTLPKDQVRRLIDAVTDEATARALFQKLEAA